MNPAVAIVMLLGPLLFYTSLIEIQRSRGGWRIWFCVSAAVLLILMACQMFVYYLFIAVGFVLVLAFMYAEYRIRKHNRAQKV